jgi:hypothetical protein
MDFRWKKHPPFGKSTPITVFPMRDSLLVGGLEHFVFFHILGIIIPTDELHHFSEG